MVYANCPNCNKDFEVDEYEDCNGLNETHFVPLFLPIFKECECGEKYAITTDCDDEYDAILIADFYEYNQ